ncbi:MAG: metallophosphoesterase [Nitrososphaeraceae archaeon]|nr:metallophosphoesterase [Nitrososphaeraceae archaeon]MDW0169462.1 metallophosphoesterase [Nitrososphaeraceae archaeon]MDW0171718.1 metallophosphoesterase [Nitrososphaeraceae archaeon]MDW0175936.1 metallophosphoesterase [Nitrososphaeraceae archaeon]MDW0180021.1 metallophosphoesterase [Nitrososphaeraceae archaeon]
MSGEATLSFRITMSFLSLVILLMFTPSQLIFAQSSTEQLPFLTQKESIKILSPVTTQKATVGKDLLISGQSSDDDVKNCSVSVIVNDIRPYQNAFAKGIKGLDDFSRWEFVLSNNYTHVIEGMNKITAKLLCESAPTRWYSVSVNGIPNLSNVQIAPPQSSPIQSVQRSNVSETNLSNIEESGNNNTSLLVSILAQKNPIARGDIQNTTITVTDSAKRPITNAEINGKLIYPGNNFEKEFVGKTDYNGMFIYSWTIGKKGDVGPLTVEVDASSQGYQSSFITNSFDIVDSSQALKDNSTLGGNLDIQDSTLGGNLDLDIQNSELDFVVAGDYGCDSKTRQTIKDMEEQDTDLAFALGDLSEVKNPNCFFDIVSKLDNNDRFKITLGEADTDSNKARSSSRFSDFVRHFDLESPFYSFDYKNVHFLAMSTGKSLFVPYANGSEQYNFISNDLRNAANNSGIDWIIVYGYRPFFTSPTIHPGTEVLRETYSPLFEKYGVDLVITSHNHNYQRSYPLVHNVEDSREPLIKDVNTSYYSMPGVPIYVGVGTAGNNLYDFRGQAPFMVSQFSETGFLHVNITKTEQNLLTGSFYNVGTGNYDDRFIIVKSKSE